MVKIPSVVHGKATFQHSCMEACSRFCSQGMFAVGRRRLRRLMETMCWRATPSGPVRKVLRELRDSQEDGECAEGAVEGARRRMQSQTRKNPATDCRSDRGRSSLAGCGVACFKVFFQDSVQQRFVEQISEVRPRFRAKTKLCRGPGISFPMLP